MKNYENDPKYLNVFEISKRSGLHKNFSFKFRVTDFLGTQMEGISPGEDAQFDITLTSTADGIYLSGAIEAQLTTTCSRCLRQKNRQIILKPNAFYSAQKINDDENIDDNLYEIEGNHYINLLEILRDCLFEKLEFNPICDENCRNEFMPEVENDDLESNPFAKLLALKDQL